MEKNYNKIETKNLDKKTKQLCRPEDCLILKI